jgi:hypothetical protein
MEKLHGEVVFHIKGDKAKVINFKNVFDMTEMGKKYGRNINDDFYRSGRSCYLYHNKIPYIIFIRRTDDCKGVKFTETEFERTVWGNRAWEDGFRSYFTLKMWQEVTLEQVKEIKQFMADSNEYLDTLISRSTSDDERESQR